PGALMDHRLEELEREALDRDLEFHPGRALALGRHQHDSRLEDFGPGAVAVYRADLERLRVRAAALTGLAGADAVERDVPLAFAGVGDERLRAAFSASTAEAVDALERYLAWLRGELALAGDRDYALGAVRFRGWLRAMERVSEPLAALEAWAVAAIGR